MSSVNRAYPRRPFACFDTETGTPLDLHNTLEEVKEAATVCAVEAGKHITVENMELATEYTKLHSDVAGRKMGIRLYPRMKKKGRSRFERMVQEYAVTQLWSWGTRVKAATESQNTRAKYKRVVNDNAPGILKPRLALYVTDEQYRVIRVNGSTTELDLFIADRWVTFTFKTPDRFLEPGAKIVAPTISIDNRDRVVFNWYVKIPVERAAFSPRYVIGVDVGITNLATAVVRNINTGEVVETSFMNRRVRSLGNKIQRARKQIGVLKNQGRLEEIEPHRKALSNRRKELAILIGQEVADLSWRYNNALVAIEDLSHIKNTMKHGRWVRGMIIDRITDMVESNGGRVMTVNPAYTSQKCHQCGTMLDMTDYHTPICVNCRIGWDRDENAAANIAGKLQDKDRYKKACQTRKNHASSKRHRNSKDTTRPLKHPLRKTTPTPKAPQNRPKPDSTHRVHHKYTVIKTRGGGVFPVLCAAGWSPRCGVSIPAVGSLSGTSDNQPHDYSTGSFEDYFNLSLE